MRMRPCPCRQVRARRGDTAAARTGGMGARKAGWTLGGGNGGGKETLPLIPLIIALWQGRPDHWGWVAVAGSVLPAVVMTMEVAPGALMGVKLAPTVDTTPAGVALVAKKPDGY